MDGSEFGVEDFGILVICCVECLPRDWLEDIQQLARVVVVGREQWRPSGYNGSVSESDDDIA